MARFAVVLPFLVLAFDVFCIVDVALTDAARVRALRKWIWVVLIVLLPVIGGVLWFILGKERSSGEGQSRTVAPDDDPEFLERLDRDEERDARIRDLEQQLAELDDDDDSRK